ncbi:HlyD family efflux transporter periplasmic adaptor subunit [Xanthomonas sp. GPE 39]|uniref:efflux RND transporter periplasmic adaptor subunit n=1 Tax=Xanthomonas sp. GPE 39 TaxID=1583099 RepID=UPI0005F2DC91|nr:HlyD family efflux transporter periplasmic adaptor subunit [Xanthomonas sp. GPE 39]
MDIVNPNFKIKKKRRRQIVIGIVAIFVVLVAAIFYRLSSAMPSIDTSSVWIDTVKRGDMLRDVRAQGTLVPLDIRWVSASTQAVVVKIEVLPGNPVKADMVLLTLSNPDVEDALRNAQSEVAAATARVQVRRSELQLELLGQRSKLAQAQSDYASAKVKFDIDAKAAAQQLIPRVQFEQGKIALKQLAYRVDVEQKCLDAMQAAMTSQMASVQAELQQKQSNLLLQRRQHDALQVRAGIDGMLQEVAVQEGQRVSPGSNLARVAKQDVLIARLKVPEMQARDVVVGKSAEIDTYNGLVAGRVSRVDPAVIDGTVRVDIALNGTLPPGTRPDLSVEGVVHIDKLVATLSVGKPAQAKIGSQISLFRLDPSGGSARRVQVRLGTMSADRVQILDGLKEGERVILSDSTQWLQYDRIRLK